MAILTKLIKGRTYSIPIYLKDLNNFPIVLSSPVQFYFRDFNQDLILQGICLQDNVDPSLWVASITVPSNLPTTTDTDNQYFLNYIALLPNGNSKEITKVFDVIDNQIQPLNEDFPVVTTLDSLFKDNLLVPSPFTLEKYSITIRDNGGTFKKTSPEVLNPPIYISNDRYNIYNFQSTVSLNTLLEGVDPGSSLQLIWNYTIEGVDYMKISPIYIMSPIAFTLINALKMTLNKGKIIDINPNLVWRDFELLHFSIQGLMRVNSTNPPTYFDINQLPNTLYYLVQKAALVEALQAWYLAFGLSSFDYQGNPISLNIDQTQYIQSLIDQTNSTLDNMLASTKQSVAVNAGRGALGVTTVTLSITSNWPSFYNRLYLGGFGGGISGWQ